jgi:hypothetical protein
MLAASFVCANCFTEIQSDTVSADGETYDGTFAIQNFDLLGNHLQGQDQSGTTHATRTLNGHFPSDCLQASQNLGQCPSAGQHRQQYQQAQDPASKVHWVRVPEAAIA